MLLAHAVSQAGGLGMLGIGSTESVDFLVQESAIARGTDQMRFGIGLHAWAIEKRPDLLDAAIEAAPFLISISFGSAAPYAERLHLRGIVLATQVNTRAEAVRAERSGVDLIRAQGTEAGGHVSGQVSTLPLLQAVLEAVWVPVLAAGGIASAHGVAAALAAGADGVWVCTALLASPDARTRKPPGHASCRLRKLIPCSPAGSMWRRGWPGLPSFPVAPCATVLPMSGRPASMRSPRPRPARESSPGEQQLLGCSLLQKLLPNGSFSPVESHPLHMSGRLAWPVRRSAQLATSWTRGCRASGV